MRIRILSCPNICEDVPYTLKNFRKKYWMTTCNALPNDLTRDIGNILIILWQDTWQNITVYLAASLKWYRYLWTQVFSNLNIICCKPIPTRIKVNYYRIIPIKLDPNEIQIKSNNFPPQIATIRCSQFSFLSDNGILTISRTQTSSIRIWWPTNISYLTRISPTDIGHYEISFTA